MDPVPDDVRPWRPATRAAFRFGFIYFGLYICTQMIEVFVAPASDEFVELAKLPPLRTLTEWTAHHVFGVTHPLVINGTGSGDTTFMWIGTGILLTIALIAAAIWTWLDRRRLNYTHLHTWFRVVVRLALGGTLVGYGMDKVIPLQMPAPSLTLLLQPFGSFTPMGVLWSSIGASPGYEVFAGCAELLGALLLFVPRTALLGALIALADMVQVFTLNMTYDVPVKLFSFHLILLSLWVLAPDAPRLARLFLLNRAVGPSAQRLPGGSARTRRLGTIVQLALGAFIVVINAVGVWRGWYEYGGGAPKSPLYGIWTVVDHAIDGQPRPALATDLDRWRRLVFDTSGYVAVQTMDDRFSYCAAAIDERNATLALTDCPNAIGAGKLTFSRPAAGRLILDGTFRSLPVRLNLQLDDLRTLPLAKAGFHWIQEYPLNR